MTQLHINSTNGLYRRNILLEIDLFKNKENKRTKSLRQKSAANCQIQALATLPLFSPSKNTGITLYIK